MLVTALLLAVLKSQGEVMLNRNPIHRTTCYRKSRSIGDNRSDRVQVTLKWHKHVVVFLTSKYVNLVLWINVQSKC